MALMGSGRATALRKLIFVAALTFSTVSQATSLKDFWSSRAPDDPRFQSAKSSLALEECLALEVSENVGVPNIIHGEARNAYYGNGGGPIFEQPDWRRSHRGSRHFARSPRRRRPLWWVERQDKCACAALHLAEAHQAAPVTSSTPPSAPVALISPRRR